MLPVTDSSRNLITENHMLDVKISKWLLNSGRSISAIQRNIMLGNYICVRILHLCFQTSYQVTFARAIGIEKGKMGCPIKHPIQVSSSGCLTSCWLYWDQSWLCHSYSWTCSNFLYFKIYYKWIPSQSFENLRVGFYQLYFKCVCVCGGVYVCVW